MRFERLYKQFLSPLTRFVFKRIGSDSEMADQIVTETFTAAWKGYKTFEHKSSFFTWLCRISLNKIADYYRDQVHRRSHLVVPSLKWLSQIESKDIAIDEKMALDEMRGKVNQVLDLLPAEKRKLLQYRYWHDLTYKEISIILSATKGRSSKGRLISTRAVEGKIYRAKKSFAKLFS